MLVALAVVLAPVATACSSGDEGAGEPALKTTTTTGGTSTTAADPGGGGRTTTTTTTATSPASTTPTTPTTTTQASTTTTTPASTMTTTTTTTVDGPGSTTTTGTSTPEPSQPISADEQAYVDALVAVSLEPDNNDFPLERAQAECIIPRWVSALGDDRFKAGGVAPNDLVLRGDGDDYLKTIDEIGDPESARAMVDALAPCGLDLVTYVAGVIAGDEGATAEQVACFTKNLPLEAIEASLVAALDGDDSTSSDLEEPIASAVEACIS